MRAVRSEDVESKNRVTSKSEIGEKFQHVESRSTHVFVINREKVPRFIHFSTRLYTCAQALCVLPRLNDLCTTKLVHRALRHLGILTLSDQW
jgi:hypothetical protein